MTFITRPSVPLPTGTVMGPPWSSTIMPRTMPSVGCMDTHLARPSPRCCSTSAMTSMGVGHLEALGSDPHGVVNRGKMAAFKRHHHHRPDDFHHFANVLL